MLRFHKNKLLIITVITGLMAFGSLSFREAPPAKPEKGPKNLKILPKDITHDELMAVMHEFEYALNFDCGDCHARSTTDPEKLDFASDAKPEKEVARDMMRMVKKLNKKYFEIKGNFVDNFIYAKYEVSCYTCHQGSEHPEKATPLEFKKQYKELRKKK